LPAGKWSGICPRCLIEAFGEEGKVEAGDSLVPGFTVIEEISRGGMGVVYRAQQHHPNRIVALKMILPHLLDSPVVRARFQAEAEAVAKLDHPNVLPIYEAGENRGMPYLAMKFVSGGSLAARRTEFLGQPRACAKLLAAAARGVHHAHERGILHRDLKPANLLLDDSPGDADAVPLVSDFGLARALETESSGLTGPASLLGTMGYLAPELFFGSKAAPTTQSDIYSLGAILYEILTRQLPFGAEGGLEVLRRADEQPAPSARAIDPNIPRDLDAICRTCLQREPSSRYRSASSLGDDLERYLNGHPVLARPVPRLVRLARWSRRKPALAALSVAVSLLLIAAIAGSALFTARVTRERHIAMTEKARAERRFNDVRKLANSVLFDYHDAIKALPGATKVRERLVKDALNYLDSLAGEAHGDPALQRELAAAYERVGDVRGGESSGSLGDIAGAVESYTKAFRIREALLALNPDDAQARRDLASSHQKIGNRLLDTGEASTGFEHLRKALTLYLGLTRERPANDDLQLELAGTCNWLGKAMHLRGDFAGALEQHSAALAICEKLAASNPRDQRYRRELWSSHEWIAYELWSQNDVAGAIEASSKARALGEALIADDPINADYRRNLVLNYQRGGDYRERSDKRGALEYFRRAVALDEELLAADPANALTRKHLAYAHKKIAAVLVDLEDNSQALLHFSKALESYEKVVTAAPADLISQFLVATCRAGVARMQARLGEVDPALEECRKAIVLLQEITGDKTGHLGRAQAYEYLGYAYGTLAASPKASASETRQRMSAARDMFRQTVNILDDLRSRQGDLGANEQWAKEIAGEIAKCDTALGK
jgi:serine/threonine protein kinase/tetratricopeptide (TPR) repeat protein